MSARVRPVLVTGATGRVGREVIAEPAVVERLASHASRVVFLSSPHRTPHPFFQASQPNAMAALHADVERRIAESGLASTLFEAPVSD